MEYFRDPLVGIIIKCLPIVAVWKEFFDDPAGEVVTPARSIEPSGLPWNIGCPVSLCTRVGADTPQRIRGEGKLSARLVGKPVRGQWDAVGIVKDLLRELSDGVISLNGVIAKRVSGLEEVAKKASYC